VIRYERRIVARRHELRAGRGVPEPYVRERLECGHEHVVSPSATIGATMRDCVACLAGRAAR